MFKVSLVCKSQSALQVLISLHLAALLHGRDVFQSLFLNRDTERWASVGEQVKEPGSLASQTYWFVPGSGKPNAIRAWILFFGKVAVKCSHFAVSAFHSLCNRVNNCKVTSIQVQDFWPVSCTFPPSLFPFIPFQLGGKNNLQCLCTSVLSNHCGAGANGAEQRLPRSTDLIALDKFALNLESAAEQKPFYSHLKWDYSAGVSGLLYFLWARIGRWAFEDI